MCEIDLKGVQNKYEYEELIKVFLRPGQYRITMSGGPAPDKNQLKREIFCLLSKLTGKVHEWGILTGVRPVKLAGELYDRLGGRRQAIDALAREYMLSAEKAELIVSIHEYQRRLLGKPEKGSVGVYVGIPFCPTRCLYCSFASYQAPEFRILEYLDALFKEIEVAGRSMKESGMKPETVYIGGGTPTTLNPRDLERLLSHIERNLDLSRLAEYTVEAGRPDTVTPEKLKIIKGAGATRVSINPQSMHAKTLELIGRAHTPEDAVEAFAMSRHEKIGAVNMDVIAGLPGEDAGDFAGTLEQVVGLGPENVTVHTLAVKRASKLIDMDRDYHYGRGEEAREMLAAAGETLAGAGYRPYYLYRQKHMAGGLENIGWCRGDAAGVYNIRIMEEMQTVAAFGAGGITKVHYPSENRLERVPNVSNYEIYIARIDEMIKRKREKLFVKGEELC
ncbi:MAG: coproporphyrinogen dehydrogenase HemZ [Clostridiales bacterium]|nr:coproporphyrinogen dehydrogenase HemZ [Clostridiales bacterium]